MAEKKLNIDNPLISGKKKTGPAPSPDHVPADSPDTKRRGLPIGYERFMLTAKSSNVQMLKDYAYTKRITIRDAFDFIMEDFFDSYFADPDHEELLPYKDYRNTRKK